MDLPTYSCFSVRSDKAETVDTYGGVLSSVWGFIVATGIRWVIQRVARIKFFLENAAMA